MKRMHVHVAVDHLKRSIGFYSALFAAEPAVTKADYAKWMLDDPRVNFAISTRGRQAGLDHLGIQVEDRVELDEIYTGCTRRAAMSSSRARQVAVTPSRRSPGSTTRLASRGKRSSPPAKTPITATAASERPRVAQGKPWCAPKPKRSRLAPYSLPATA